MNFAYDGFGNLTQQGSTTLSVDATTNRINTSGYQYNANGNLVGTPDGTSYVYDVSNRLVSNGAIYNPRNQRVYDGTYFYLYTPGGKVLGKYTALWSQASTSQAVIVGQPNVYFAGRLLQEQGHWVMVDRLGSVRKSGTGESAEFNPYGDERTPLTSNGRTKFAGYFRDTVGLDYAMARYYSATTGRFGTPDPGGMRTAGAGNPGSWNRYAYVVGDPVNRIDPYGRDDCDPEDPCCDPDDPDEDCSNPCLPSEGFHANFFGEGCAYPPPPPPPPGPPAATCTSVLTQNLQSFLQTNDAAALRWDTTLAADLVVEGATVNIDPRLMASILTVESGHGGSFSGNNPFGLGPGNSYTSAFGAIQAEGSTLKKFVYTYKETSVSALYSGNGFKVDPKKPWIVYQYPAYCYGGPTGAQTAACQAAGVTIEGFLSAQSGNASVGLTVGNPNNLADPCNND